MTRQTLRSGDAGHREATGCQLHSGDIRQQHGLRHGLVHQTAGGERQGEARRLHRSEHRHHPVPGLQQVQQDPRGAEKEERRQSRSRRASPGGDQEGAGRHLARAGRARVPVPRERVLGRTETALGGNVPHQASRLAGSVPAHPRRVLSAILPARQPDRVRQSVAEVFLGGSAELLLQPELPASGKVGPVS